MRRLSVRWIDERPNCTRTRGIRVGWLQWRQDEPPFHYGYRHFQAHLVTWNKTPERPALKFQLEAKTFRTNGMRSADGSKRYVRIGVCL